MRIRGLHRLARPVLKLTRLLSPQALVLTYHRVADALLDPYKISVSPRHFAEHLDVIRRTSNLISMASLLDCQNSGKLPKRAVVLTFDDGYLDNLTNALPLLRKFNMPATVYVTTGGIGGDRAFWFDDLVELLLVPKTLPARLGLTVGWRVYDWSFEGADYRDEDDAMRHRNWSMDQPDLGPRQAALRALHKLLRPLSHMDRSAALSKLAEWAGVQPTLHSEQRVLRPAEIIELANSGLVEIGAHTVTHPVLSSLPRESQQWEIRESKAQLEAILQRQVTQFAYPYGGLTDYDSATVELLREAGFACSCTTSTGLVSPVTDPYRFPRFHVVDCGGDQFARMLDSWFLS